MTTVEEPTGQQQERAWEGAGLKMHAQNKRRSRHSSSVNITAPAATQAATPVDSVLPLKSPTRAFLRASTGWYPLDTA